MKTSSRKFSGASKAQVAIEALNKRDSLAELSKKFEVHPNMISKWKQEFLDRAAEIFETKSPEKQAHPLITTISILFFNKLSQPPELKISIDFL